jgi:hypothetical protein
MTDAANWKVSRLEEERWAAWWTYVALVGVILVALRLAR